jgi:2-octaprenyl-6-methoxyphenol hydroxylase
MSLQPDFDVVIVGGGMAGASLAIALAAENTRIAMIEAVLPGAEDQPSYDDRGLALSLSSQRILNSLDLWDAVCDSANPIEHVHVSDQHHFGFVRLHAEQMNLSALGHVVLARELGRILMERISVLNNIHLICPARVRDIVIHPDHAEVILLQDGNKSKITAHLVVAADGSSSPVREILGISTDSRDYGQTAIVTNVTPGKPHNNTAFERFTEQGPLALLPSIENRCVVVFAVGSESAEQYLNMSDDEFLTLLQSRLGRRLGKFQRLGKRKSYPMQLILAREQVRERVVILGNAAHTLHPNGAQGFNLCLRDIAGLAEILLPALRNGDDPGHRHLLNQYQDLRISDQSRVTRFTDGLVKMFYNDLPHKIWIRNTGMLLLDICPSLKRSFALRAMGLHGKQPAMVRGFAP